MRKHIDKSDIRKKGFVQYGFPKAEPNTVRKAWGQSGNPQCRAGSWPITLFPHTRNLERDQEVGEVANSQHTPHFSDALLAPGSLLLLNFPQLPKQSYQLRTKCSKEPLEDISY